MKITVKALLFAFIAGVPAINAATVAIYDNHTITSLRGYDAATLEYLVISSCPNLSSLAGLYAPALKRLTIYGCRNLLSLDGLHAPALERLTIEWCHSLSSLDGLYAPKLLTIADFAGHIGIWVGDDHLRPSAEALIRLNRKVPFLATVVLAERARAAEEARSF